jgi:hypothetical protein
MNKITLIFITIFLYLLSPTTFAHTVNSIPNTTYGYNYNDGEKFTFVEGGITFSVFRNGEFDFYINRKNGIHTNVNFGLVSISYNSGYNYDTSVQYDDYGAIVQIENIPIYYDYYGRIIGAGDVKINYRTNRIVSIGGMNVYYNTYGYYSHYRGFINPYNRYYVYHPYHNYFVRPYYDRCIVSYHPYRRHYKPYRNDYHYGKNKNNGHYNYKKRNFKRVDSKVSSRETRRINNGVNQKDTQDRRISRNSTMDSRQNLQRNLASNRDRNIRTKPNDKKLISNRNEQSVKKRGSSSELRIPHNVKKGGAKTSQRRTVGLRNTPEKSVKQYKTVQRSRATNIKPNTKRVSERNATQRTSSRSESYKQTKVQNSIRKKNIHPRNKRAVAGRSNTRKSVQ